MQSENFSDFFTDLETIKAIAAKNDIKSYKVLARYLRATAPELEHVARKFKQDLVLYCDELRWYSGKNPYRPLPEHVQKAIASK